MTVATSRPGPERQGYEAFQAGQGRDANPYPFSTSKDQCIAWARGYAMARTDLARKRRTAKKGDSK